MIEEQTSGDNWIRSCLLLRYSQAKLLFGATIELSADFYLHLRGADVVGAWFAAEDTCICVYCQPRGAFDQLECVFFAVPEAIGIPLGLDRWILFALVVAQGM